MIKLLSVVGGVLMMLALTQCAFSDISEELPFQVESSIMKLMNINMLEEQQDAIDAEGWRFDLDSASRRYKKKSQKAAKRVVEVINKGSEYYQPPSAELIKAIENSKNPAIQKGWFDPLYVDLAFEEENNDFVFLNSKSDYVQFAEGETLDQYFTACSWKNGDRDRESINNISGPQQTAELAYLYIQKKMRTFSSTTKKICVIYVKLPDGSRKFVHEEKDDDVGEA